MSLLTCFPMSKLIVHHSLEYQGNRQKSYFQHAHTKLLRGEGNRTHSQLGEEWGVHHWLNVQWAPLIKY